ncbi:DUF1905 domain-containing protein [Halobacteriovorax sp. HLS]|uniref:DUF1905 domain-containing protein n=1 Tax=Halobacteriovorax sp. HLS TaxID=2234000 RepID=UPI000FD6E675|nr:DUF1905 domain-containing protein [Halobacteriovorax sp. HLS]
MNNTNPEKKDIFNFSFKGKLWKDKGKGAWHFITVSKKLSREIRNVHKDSEEGWGRLKTKATIGNTTWKTSIWFDTKADAYLFPVNALTRKKEALVEGSTVEVCLEFSLDKWLMDKL